MFQFVFSLTYKRNFLWVKKFVCLGYTNTHIGLDRSSARTELAGCKEVVKIIVPIFIVGFFTESECDYLYHRSPTTSKQCPELGVDDLFIYK